MAIFVDTGAFLAFLDRSDEHHSEARELFAKMADSQFGTPFTSDYVFSEAVTVAYRRTKRKDFALELGRFILGESSKPLVVMARVVDSTFSSSWNLFQRYATRGLSFTDCTSLAMMQERRIGQIASYDADFDGLAERITH